MYTLYIQGYRIFNTWMGDPTRVILLEAQLRYYREHNLLENAAKVGQKLIDGMDSVAVRIYFLAHMY